MSKRKIPSDRRTIITDNRSDGIKRNTYKISSNENDKPVRSSSFEYAALPKYEMSIYWSVVIIVGLYAWHRVYLASRAYIWDDQNNWTDYEDHKWPLGLGTHRRDVSESEWQLWTQLARKMLPFFIMHAFLFNFFDKIFSETNWKILVFLNSLIAHCFVSSPLIMLISIAQGVLIFCLARWFKSKAVVWSVGACLMYVSTLDYFDEEESRNTYTYPSYIRSIVFPYKMLQYLSYTTDMIDQEIIDDSKIVANDQKQKSKQLFASTSFLGGLWEMFWYAFYLPYSLYLIVIYKRFPQRLQQRQTTKSDWSKVAFFGVRIFFWYLITELWLYVFFQEAIMNTPSELYKISEDTLVSIGMAVGQFFHIKYVVIFGLPAFFARLDNMQPLQGPMCIARVVLYAKLWRYFDRGLYDFFKEYIFLPICRPTFSVGRKFFGLLVSYAFVLIWHGATHQYMIWIILNIVEILVEISGKVIYSIPSVRKWREVNISDQNFRRILAFIYWVPYAFGLYANFYFLGSSEAGWAFVDRIFWQETVNLRWPFFLLIFLCYFLAQVCIEIERKLDSSKENLVKRID